MKIVARDIPPRTAWALEQAGVHPLLARLYAARGVQSKDELDDGLARLLPPSGMKGIDAAARLLADAMAKNQRLVIVADYDCDGATACAVGVRGGVDTFESRWGQQPTQAIVQFILGAHAARGIQARQQRVHAGLFQRPGGAGGNVSCYYFHS